MRTLGLLLMALTALAVTADASDSANVTLRVGPVGLVVPNHWLVGNPSVWTVEPSNVPGHETIPGLAGCGITAYASGEGVSGSDALDAATGAGCISGWSSQTTSFGRMVASVDGLDQAADGLAAWWFIQVDGVASSVGIDDVRLTDGSQLDLVYYVGPL